MTNFWNQSGIPHKGWHLADVIDVRADGQSEEDTQYETCMMCGNEKIRYVHIVEHAEIDDEFRVGCICAEKMTDDYTNPAKRENELRNRSKRRLNWSRKKWRTSHKGNLYLRIDHHVVVVFKDGRGKYKVRIGETLGQKDFETVDLAKAAAFEGIEYFKELGKW
jgi:biotin synthase-related radical SAM superfamily protein